MHTHEIIAHSHLLPVHFHTYGSVNSLVPSHWHHHLEILFIDKGTMHLVRNDKRYVLEEGDLFVVNSGYVHSTRTKGEVVTTMLQVPKDLVASSIRDYDMLEFNELLPRKILKDDEHFKKLVSLMETMKHIYETKEKGYAFKFNSILQQFLGELYIHFSAGKNMESPQLKGKYEDRLRQVITYVNNHYNETIPLDDIASIVALNTEYFCRMFKRHMGLTFTEYVNTVRLAKIHKDLLETDDPVTMIQNRHGFINYKVFSRMFKETYGCTPSKFRERR